MTFREQLCAVHSEPLRAIDVETLEVNVGYRCNMVCKHCHVEAGPKRPETMNHETIDAVLSVIKRERVPILDITGGAPELNPGFRYLAEKARALSCHVISRTNLTIFYEPGMEDLPEFYASQQVELIASFPSCVREQVDRIRGTGTFEKSVRALRKLNSLGYGLNGSGLTLNIISNPQDASLPPPEQSLEKEMRRELLDRYDVSFTRLYALANMPVGRFKKYLQRHRSFDRYQQELMGSFNSRTLEGIMCRHLINVGPDGRLYDCDFNQMVGLTLLPGYPQHIAEFDCDLLSRRAIAVDDHCFACTAGSGST
jgi:radical SAM/Cys-rich protein